MVPHGKAHTQACTVHRAWSYLELPVCCEVGAPVEARVELHPVPGDPGSGPGPQLGVAEQGAALRGHVVTPSLQAAAWKQDWGERELDEKYLQSGFKWVESEQM